MTLAEEPIKLPLPMVTPGEIVQLAPILTSSSIVGALTQSFAFRHKG